MAVSTEGRRDFGKGRAQRGRLLARGSRAHSESGFSMVEMAVVAIMIAILAAIALPVARYSVRRQKELELRHQLRTMRDAIDQYKKMSDSGLIPLEIGGEGYPPDLDKLVEGVNLVGQTQKKQRFLRRIPIDPMTGKADWGKRSYQDDADSQSWGGQNVYDVHSLSEAKALDGTFYKDW